MKEKSDADFFLPTKNNQTTIGVEAIVGSYGLGFGFIFAFLGMVFFVYVCELFPVDVRNAGVGLSYNIGILDFGLRRSGSWCVTWKFKGGVRHVQGSTPQGTNTYPSKMAFWRWFSFSQDGIC